ncbi:FxSxx-COOH system tetratricopeptide repeat protein [Yinghuangia sp. ASG 101]|uniref:FxSxx-COOH system tetratricopeptide repeat protein n=1 Tax=Yinghuangia sp. ASG 101 TaxID=2896848 RepID=UPI001E52562B|nr:FxSxx-COOH system tetratricopeptide repeat protein [Yinghuangia sp. ASG 101]UGQ12635.1 FxSxx-COOH system tetratricopeptide repeat protein [Yinghuangia sp. ASG 101]
MTTPGRHPARASDTFGVGDLTHDEVADALWLAMCWAGRTAAPPRPDPPTAPPPPGRDGHGPAPRTPLCARRARRDRGTDDPTPASGQAGTGSAERLGGSRPTPLPPDTAHPTDTSGPTHRADSPTDAARPDRGTAPSHPAHDDPAHTSPPHAAPEPAPSEHPSPHVVPSTPPDPKRPPLPPNDAEPFPPDPHRSAPPAGDGGAIAVTWPSVPGLTGRRAIERALRPLRRAVPSAHRYELDEDATADALVGPEPRLPCLRPARERWLELVLVVDAGATMPVWRHTVGEFTELLRRTGVFRSVTVRRLDTDGADDGDLELRGPVSDAARLSLAEPTSPAPRRVVMVLTDAAGAAWRSGAVQRLLGAWGSQVPVVVTHLLNERSWYRTWLDTRTAGLGTHERVPFGARLFVETRSAPDGSAVPARDRPVVPVLELSAHRLHRWASLLADASGTWPQARVMALPSASDHHPHTPGDWSDTVPDAFEDDRTAAELVLDFRASASPVAFRLAQRLAAAPLTVAMMEMVQFFTEPDSTPAHLAEVVTSGLLAPARSGTAAGDGPGVVRYAFLPGVAEELLASAKRTDTADVMRRVVDRLDAALPHLRGTAAGLVAAPVGHEPDLPEGANDLVRPVAHALRALSGPYLPWAERLHARLRTPGRPGDGGDPDARPSVARSDGLDTLRSEVVEVPENPSADSGSVPEPAPAWSDRWGQGLRDEQGSGEGDSVAVSADSTRMRRPGVVERAIAERRRADSPPPVWGNMPPRNVNFTGRVGALLDLHERLTQGTTAVLPEALHGMGGVGKSQIAVEYAYRHSSDYDIVWWIPAGQPAQIRAAFVDLAQRLRLLTGAEANIAVPAVLEALRLGEPYRNWLLVFDNAESPESVLPFFPQGGTGRILVTSRNGQWVNMARTIEVDVFARDESIELLRRRGPVLTDEQANRLSEALGDLPLAIEQAAVWLAETGMRAEEYLELFEGKREEFVSRRAELLELAPPMDYQLPVAAAWNVSLDRLRDTNPAALELLQVCAYFAPEPVSRRLFMAGRNAALPGLLGEMLSDPIRLGHALRGIHRYALARIDYRTDSIQLHRLVQAVLIDQMTPEQRATMQESAHLLLAGSDPAEPGRVANWPRYAELLPHLRASGAVRCDNRWVRALVANCVSYLHTFGDYEACRELGEEVLATWRETLGPDDLQTLSVARVLGHVLRSLGQYAEAADLNRDTLERLRRTLGPGHEDSLFAARAVAVDLRAAGDFVGAAKLNKEVHELAMRSFGDRDPYTLSAAVDHATALRLVGDFSAARDLDAVALQLAVEMLGEDHLLTMLLGSLLALDLRECGDYGEAAEMQENNWARFALLVGGETPSALVALRNLGIARRSAGDHDGALEACADAWERHRRRYGDDGFDTLCAAASLAIAQRQVGDLAGAREFGGRTLDRCKRNLGESHPYTLSIATNLAVAMRNLGETESALALSREAYEGLAVTVGPDHPYTLCAAVNLASDLFAQGAVQEACELDQNSYRRIVKAQGDEHPTALACALNLSADLRALGRTNQAETLYAATLATMRRVLGRSHPATVGATQGERADCDVELLVI